MTALDDYTVGFTLKEPFAAFPVQLVLPADRPRRFRRPDADRSVGTGPYRLVRYDDDDKVVLAAFEGY